MDLGVMFRIFLGDRHWIVMRNIRLDIGGKRERMNNVRRGSVKL
jgi:hypothetical protein